MKIFIGCSACDEISSEYFDETKRFLEKLMPGHDLVFGTCKSGLMGIAHDITKKLGGKVIGVCPAAYKDDFKTLQCDVEIITKTVSERTDSVIKESDALVFIAGGIGTLYELLTAIECKRCHEFDKPIVIYNGTGYFDKLLDFFNQLYTQRFVREQDKTNYLISSSVEEIKDYIENYNKQNIAKTQKVYIKTSN